MARELAFTYVPAGSAKHERKDFSAGESISIRFVRVGSDSVAGQTFRYVVSPSIDGSAPLFSSTSFTIEADGDLVIGLATADTYAWASGDYQGELRRVDSGYNTVCRKTVHGVKENPLNNGTPPVIPDNEIDWDHVSGTPTTLAGYGITDAISSDGTLAALAALTIAANTLTIGTGADAFSQTSFAANTFPARASTGSLAAKPITDFGLSLVDDADAATARTTIGLGALDDVTFTNLTINEDFFVTGSTIAVGGFQFGAFGLRATFTTASLSTNRSYAWPDAAGTVVLDSATQALTNKTINGNTHTTGTGTLTLSTYTLTATASGNVVVANGSGDVTISGNLTVSGDTFTANTASYTVEDPLIALGSGNAGDAVDEGWYASYTATGVKYRGIFWDASASVFRAFTGLEEAPTTTVNIAGTGYTQATIAANISGNAATVTTNANLTGPITSTGNATNVASQTGTGSTFVMSTSPTITNPLISARDAAITADSPSGTTFTLDLSASDVHSISTLAADSTVALSNTGTQKRFAIIFLDNTSNKTITWFSGITWLTTLTQPALGAKISVASFIKTGAGAYLGWMSQQP